MLDAVRTGVCSSAGRRHVDDTKGTSRPSLPVDGTLTSRETFVDGIENAVDGLLGVLKGKNTGKMVVRL